MSDRQCPSCGGFCKKSGCERISIKLDNEREAFEEWFDAPRKLELAHDGSYKFIVAEDGWRVWQAACQWQREQEMVKLSGGFDAQGYPFMEVE